MCDPVLVSRIFVTLEMVHLWLQVQILVVLSPWGLWKCDSRYRV